MRPHKKLSRIEERREERIEKGFRERKHQRRASESLRRIQTMAKNIDDIDDYLDEFDEMYDDD